MIYRKWSLLTGPTSLFVGIIGAVVVADIAFIENVTTRKPEWKKQEPPSTLTK